MNTFDVFDTLLARRHITSDPIWHQMEREYNIPGFVDARKSADTGTRGLREIYSKLVDNGIVPATLMDEFVRREIELEISVCFPVQQNIDRVQHGDVLISDMYLPGSAIMQLVRSVGMNRQVTLYQSNGDKSNGTIWPRLLKTQSGTHLGDNRHSDFNVPRQFNVDAEWYAGTGLNTVEQNTFDQGFANVALLCREIRLRNNPADPTYFNLACDVNLPALFMLAELVHRTAGSRDIVFLGRDCQLLYKLYTAYYGTAYYLPFSRKVAFDQPADAVNYLQTHSPHMPLYVDISSTGGTWAQLAPYANLDVLVAIYSDMAYYTPERPVPPDSFTYLTTNTQIGQTNLLIEMFNCGDHGHLKKINIIDRNLMQAEFAEPELPKSLVYAVHTPINQAVELSSIYADAIREELSAQTGDSLKTVFGQLAMMLCNQVGLLADSRKFLEQETKYLEQFTKEK